MLTVRELFLKALSMKLSGQLATNSGYVDNSGRDIGIKKIGTDFVEFRSGQRIWFDGRCHLTTLWQGWSSMRPLAPAEEDAKRIILQRLQRRGDHGDAAAGVLHA